MWLIKFLIKIIFIFIGLTWIINLNFLAQALPCYKNFKDTDVISSQIKLGYWKSNSYIKEYNYRWYEEGLSASLAINPLYNLNFFRNIFFNLQTNISFTPDIKNKSVALLVEYNFPIILNTPVWVPDIILFGGIGGGINNCKIESSRYNPIIIDKVNNIKLYNYGVIIIPAQLRETKFSIYLENKSIYSNYTIYEYNNKNYLQYKNTFVTIGICYNINYLFNKENLNAHK